MEFLVEGVPTFLQAAKSVEATIQDSGQMHEIHPADGRR